ncbi:MAG: hypothetical protein B7X78_08865, partial [Sphingomonadales bacterium 39-62-4]
TGCFIANCFQNAISLLVNADETLICIEVHIFLLQTCLTLIILVDEGEGGHLIFNLQRAVVHSLASHLRF